jgi:basic membrane protein A and related proteins
MKKLFVFVVAIVLLFSFFGCKKDSKNLKVAFVYVGAVADGGWTAAHDQARLELEKEFPGITTSFVESVPEGSESERTITNFAQKGYDVIFTTSFGFMDPTVNVAKKFPKTVFMHCSGYKRDKNLGTYFGAMEQAKFLAGIIAGKMTKKNVIGFVAPHPIPEVIRHINAFAIGVRQVNPKAKVKVVWTNSWFDPAKEKEAANSLIEAGADIIASGADSTAPILAAEEKGGKVYSIGYDSDMSQVAPKSYLTSPIWNWIVIYKDVIQKIKDGSVKDWSTVDYYDGLNTGIVALAPLSALVPQDVKDLVDKKTEEIKSGTEKVFVGPLKKQDGSVALEKDAVAPLSDLLSMMYFVEGVEGTIPTN